MDLSAWKDAQTAVLGSVLIDPEHTAGIVFSTARPEHFGDAACRHVFEAARGLWAEKKPVDPVTVAEAAGSSYRDFIRDAMIGTPTAANVEAYLALIRDMAKLGAIQGAAYEIINAEGLEAAAGIYEKLGQQLRDREGFEDRSLASAIGDYFDRMQDGKKPDYLRFGIEQLDRFLNVSPGQFVILAADSSVGKTALALQFAWHMASTGKKVGFFSLETSAENLTERILAEKQVAGINLPRSKAKALNDRDYREGVRAASSTAAGYLRILNRFRTIEQIRGRTVMRGFDVVFVDYVQLLDGEGRERWDIVTNISIGLHRMAQELGVTVIGLSQITPPSKESKKAPTKDDLRESRQLKHDADVILILSISQEGSGMFRELAVAKNKDGPLGRILLDFEPENMSFSYRPPHEPNAYAEVQKAARKAAREHGGKQQSFEDVEEQEELPF